MEALERELLGLAHGVVEGRFEPSAEPHFALCADCPGRAALCVHESELTLRLSVGPRPNVAAMPLCFIEPQEAIRVVAESVGREARRQLLGEVVRAWVDEIPGG